MERDTSGEMKINSYMGGMSSMNPFKFGNDNFKNKFGSHVINGHNAPVSPPNKLPEDPIVKGHYGRSEPIKKE